MRNLILAPRRRVRNLHGKRQQMVRRCQCRFNRHSQIALKFAMRNWNPRRRHDLRLSHWNRLPRATFASNLSYQCLSMNLESGKNEFKMSSFTTTLLNLLFTEAEKKDNIHFFRIYIGPGLDGSSADKLSLDLKFNPWDTTITQSSRSMTHLNPGTRSKVTCGLTMSKNDTVHGDSSD